MKKKKIESGGKEIDEKGETVQKVDDKKLMKKENPFRKWRKRRKKREIKF